MPKNTANNLGGIIGFVLGLALIGGLAATPLYINLFRVDARQLDDSTEEQIQQIRRIALNLDHNLSALSDLYVSRGSEAEFEADEISAILEKEPNIIPNDRAKKLERSARDLQSIESKDQERGTGIEDGRVKTGRPNPRTAPSTMRSKYLQAHAKLLQTADSAINKLQTVSAGTEDAKRHLGTNRVSAIIYLAKGRIERNRAEFEQLIAARLWRHAEKQVEAVAELQRSQAATTARLPAEALSKIEERVSGQSDMIEKHRGEIAQLEQEISSTEERIATLDNEAMFARNELARLDTSGAAIHQESSRYRELSEAARRAEAKAAALRNGTLEGAVLVGDKFEEMLTARYEGGEPKVGVRDKKLRLEQKRRALAGLEKERDSLLERRAALLKLSQELKTRAGVFADDAEAQLSKITQLFEQAGLHLESADKASESAMTSFKKAERFVGPAINAASRRLRDARQAKAGLSAGLESDRLAMIISDGDMEGSLHCLKAEIAYHAALTRCLQVMALRSKHKVQKYIAESIGRNPPSIDESVNELIEEAGEKLNVARETYKAADTNISKTRAKTPRGTVQGKDYLWQIRVGQAAVHLVGAALAADSLEADAEKAAAYELLKEAAQGREQSPLLGPAVETLLQLQQTAN